MINTYKFGFRRFDEKGVERIYNVLYDLRLYYVHDFERYIALSACMEELTKRSKRLKALVEKAEWVKHENRN